MFGFRDKSIIAQNRKTIATITDVKKCWWFKVNTQPVRISGMGSALFPHIICFSYEIDSVQYRGKRFLNYTIPAPSIGAKIEIYYDASKPSRCAVKL